MISKRNAWTALFLLLSASSASAGPGIVYVDGLIDDHPVRFVVDTGADEISIPYSEAIRMGLPVFVGPRSESSTASGTVGIYRLTLGSVSVGGVTLHNVAAHVSESDLGVKTALLGMSFLGRVNACFLRGKLQIGDPAAEQAAPARQQACPEQTATDAAQSNPPE